MIWGISWAMITTTMLATGTGRNKILNKAATLASATNDNYSTVQKNSKTAALAAARFYRFSSAQTLKLFMFKSKLLFYWDENIFFYYWDQQANFFLNILVKLSEEL